MRLLKRDESGKFVFESELRETPPYAILSHTWGPALDEVLFQDICDGTAHQKKAFDKLEFIANQAEKEGYHYYWVDTCCIDKRDPAELGEAIRSMFRWYSDSAVCYVFLTDVPINKRKADGSEAWGQHFYDSRWFSRGWTLQELLAPSRVEFYAREQYIGSRADYCDLIYRRTGIDTGALQGRSLDRYTLRAKLQWANGRQTTKEEDRAYALMGLCKVSMSVRYGEGLESAQSRLNRKIRQLHGENALDPPTVPVDGGNGMIGGHENLLEQRRVRMETLRFDTMDSRKRTISKALRKTCNWILTNRTYQSWLNTQAMQQHNGLFWIRGKPGAGKSVLIKYLNDHTVRTKKPQDVCISFYFNARGETLEKSLVGMYRSLLQQLLTAVPALQTVLDDSSQFTSKSEDTVLELQTLLLEATLQLRGRRLFCFIDALDECRENDVQQMVDYFHELGKDALDADVMVNVCFASRHYPALTIPTPLFLVLETATEHEDDLKMYVESQYFQVGLEGHRESVPVDIQEEILRKANGVFLWIRLVVQMLKEEYPRGRIEAVRKKLDELPEGLSQLFQNIVQRDRRNIDEFLLCLKWILYAVRPLRLREFYYAMKAGADGQSLEMNSGVTKDCMHAFLLDSSKGLAEPTRDEDPYVQFIHESVPDYFLREDGFKHVSEEHQLSAGLVHDALKQCCARGVQSDLREFLKALALTEEGQDFSKGWKPSASRGKRAKLRERFPFLEYATTYVFHHADQAAQEVSQWSFLSKFDLDNWIDKANYLQKQNVKLYNKPLRLDYLFAECGYATLICTLAVHNYNFNKCGNQRYVDSLFAAFANGHKAAAWALLVQQGASDPGAIVHDVMISDARKRADYERQKRTVASRVDRGSLHRAIKLGHESLACHLISNVVEGGNYYFKCLETASNEGSKKLVKMLLDRLYPSQDDRDCVLFRYGVMIAACEAGSKKFVELLLNKYDIDSQHDEGDTALIAASRCGQRQIVRLLVEHGASIDVQAQGYTALAAACRWDDLHIVEYLLKEGADVNAIGSSVITPLQAALYKPYRRPPSRSLLEVLVSHGADVNMAGGGQHLPLHDACVKGWPDTVTFLLNHGADVNAEAHDGSRALTCAAKYGHRDIVCILLEWGADINARPASKGSALELALFFGKHDVARLLVERGASTYGGILSLP